MGPERPARVGPALAIDQICAADHDGVLRCFWWIDLIERDGCFGLICESNGEEEKNVQQQANAKEFIAPQTCLRRSHPFIGRNAGAFSSEQM